MLILTIANQKGGTGKSTLAVLIAQGESLRGKKTLLIDLDSQGDSTFALSPQSKPVKTTFDLLTDESTASLPPVESITDNLNLDLMPASKRLSQLDIILAGRIDAQFILKEKLEQLGNEYDLVVIDTSPALNYATQNALTASDFVLIPVQADVFSLKGLSALNAIIKAIQKRSNPQLKTAGIVINRFNPRTNYSKAIKGMLENTAKEFDSHVFTNTIRDAVAIREAFAGFEPLFEYDPKGKAKTDVDAVLNELEREIGL